MTTEYIPVFDDDAFDDIVNTPISEDIIMEDVNTDDTFDIPETQTTETAPQEGVKYSDKSDAQAIAFFEDLKERNYIIEKEDRPFDGTWESVDAYIEELPQAVLNSVVANLPPVSKDVMRFIANAGDNITKDEMKNFFQTYFEELEQPSVQIETIDSAREFLESVYKNQGIKPSLISVMLDKLEDDDSILDEAKSELEKQDAKPKKTEDLISQKSQEAAAIKQQQTKFVQDIQSELTNSGWKPERINKIQSVLKGQEFNNTLKTIVSNPKALVQLADLITYYDKNTNAFNLDVFMKQKETAQVLSLKERIEKNQFGSKGSSAQPTDNPNSKKYEKIVPVFD